MAKRKRIVKGGPPTGGFVTEFRHHRTGKLMKASDYGHRAWPIGKRKG